MTHNNRSVAENLRKTVRKLKDQLKAVKKFVEKEPPINLDTMEDCQQFVDDWLGKLMKILEADG